MLHAECGDVALAERLFTQAQRSYRGTSPFPVAALDYRRGLMWSGRGDLTAARSWFGSSCRRVPAYAPALGRLAGIDAAQGDYGAAIERLRPLASACDDPEYASQLSIVLRVAGHVDEARSWYARATARYGELALRHPETFAGHAAVATRQGRLNVEQSARGQ